ncbi:MAG: protein serine/threonine phosphatase [Frankiales bacterium]|nr:protein serine/threonine phosphatase [Frankiales bacterium]
MAGITARLFVRAGDTVRRVAGPWTPNLAALPSGVRGYVDVEQGLEAVHHQARSYTPRMDLAAGRPGLSGLLDAAEDASPVEAVDAVTRRIGLALGATEVSFLVADLSGRGLVRLTHVPLAEPRAAHGPDERRDEQELATELPFDGGPAEKALRTQVVQVLPPASPRPGDPGLPGLWTVLAPVTERGEALGLLELSLPVQPGQDVLDEIARTAHLLGFVIIAGRRHTDLYEWGQRSTPFSLSAEVQRRLLPAAFTCEAGSFTLSAWLEPAESVGGDTFDYSLARDVLHLSMTDAMGHGVASSLTATLCVGSLRNARRHGASLVDQAGQANAALLEHGESLPVECFATGLLGRLDLCTGELALLNAGHVAPYLLRRGRVEVVDLPADLPFGLFSGATYRVTPLVLEPGDRLVLVTDGMVERNAKDLDLPELIVRTSAQHPREATRHLADMVLEATGHALADDATLLLLDWHGDHGNGRDTTSGSSA